MKEGRTSDPLSALKANGYSLDGFDASGVLGYTIPPLAPRQFDHYDTLLGQDSTVIDSVLARMATPTTHRRLVFGFLYSTHAAYFHPTAGDVYPVKGPGIDAHTELHNRYRNAVRYVDALIGRVDSALAPRLAAGSAVLVVTGDHGEEFWEHGLFGHAAVAFDDERTRVPMVMCFPRAREMHASLSTHADVMPTLFDWMGAAGWDSTRITGRSMLAAAPRTFAAIAGAGYPTQAGAFALATPHFKFWLHLTGPDFAAIAVDRVTDASDHTVAMSSAAERELNVARSAFVNAERAVLRIN